MPADADELRRRAAEHGALFVESGMTVGLGHGATALFALRKIAQRLAAGELRDIRGVPCSRQVEADATALAIPLTTLEEHPVIDLTIDGADEVAPALNLIKGGGGALLREKIVAQASRREIIVVDGAKLTAALGTRFRVPVEVVRFGRRCQQAFLEALGAEAFLRADDAGEPFITDEGNLIFDCDFGPIADPAALARRLEGRAGIVEHGMFIGLATDVIVADEEGGIRHLTREGDRP